MNDVRARAEPLVRAPVRLADRALAFDKTTAHVRVLGYPAMLHAKAFVRDREEMLAGTCNLEAWSLKRFFEIDLRVRSRDFAARFSAPAETISTPGAAPAGLGPRLEAAAFAAISPLL